VIDENGRAILLADQLQTALGAGEMFDRREGACRVGARRNGEAGGDKRVLDLKLADQWQTQAMAAATVLDRDDLGETVDRRVNQPDAVTAAADGEHLELARLGGGEHLDRAIVLDTDPRGAAGRHQRGEQTQLRGEVGCRRAVIVEMVARDIGEAGDGDAQAVETALVEAVGRGFDSKMSNAVAREPIERAVQLNRIGRSERAVVLAARRYDADGADARGLAAERGPDLAREHGDRRLA